MIRKTDPQAIAPYLKDASNFSGGQAAEVVIPETVAELVDFLKTNREPITVAGAGTGLTASRIPTSGIVVSMERLNKIGPRENSVITVEPAVRLAELETHLRSTAWFYPPNPTEMLAFVGGTIATNASGSRSYKFGATRDYVVELEVVLADGRLARPVRGQTIDTPLECTGGAAVRFPDVRYHSPPCKNAAGYYVRPGMDWIDLFVGSDGTLGIITQAKLRLLPRPADFISGVLFFSQEEFCWRLVKTFKACIHPSIRPCSLEYFDRYSLQRLKPAYGAIPARAVAALFFEQDVSAKADYDPLLQAWYEFLEAEEVLLDDSWFAQSPRDQEHFYRFRHEIPLILNEENSRLGRVKIGTDMAVGDEHFLDMMRFYRDQLERSGLDYVVFGHIGDNHLHINLLPGREEAAAARDACQALVDQILAWRGTISAEHGVGKLKKDYFRQMVGEGALRELRQIKTSLDPDGLLGIGNML
ncbi:MAG: FAD-binding oxidoreductase [Nitrospinales bacterium]